jgi:hypothetical protein
MCQLKDFKKLRLLSFYLLILLLSLVSCAPNEASSIDINVVPLPLSELRPDFIKGVSPEEAVTIPLSLYEGDETERYFEESGIYYIGALRNIEIGYRSTICVMLDVGSLAQSGDKLTESPLVLERIEMKVNGVILSEVVDQDYIPTLESRGISQSGEQLEQVLYSGPLTFCWLANLNSGVHRASFQFQQTSGDVQEYTWHFTIVDD